MKDYKRIVCAFETWIKELQEPFDYDTDEPDTDIRDRCINWIVNTYLNEIQDGDYVSDEEYTEWLFQESKGGID